MKKYRLLKDWETPFDGDIVFAWDLRYSMRENTFVRFLRAYRVSHFKNSSLSALLTDCTGKMRWCCLVNNQQIVKAYTPI